MKSIEKKLRKKKNKICLVTNDVSKRSFTFVLANMLSFSLSFIFQTVTKLHEQKEPAYHDLMTQNRKVFN